MLMSSMKAVGGVTEWSLQLEERCQTMRHYLVMSWKFQFEVEVQEVKFGAIR